MANKNTKRLNKLKSQSLVKGNDSVTIDRPVGNYHSVPSKYPSGYFATQSFPITGKPNKNGVISASPRRNMCMRIYVNTGESASSSQSITRHEPIVPHSPVRHKNHSYLKEYRHPVM